MTGRCRFVPCCGYDFGKLQVAMRVLAREHSLAEANAPVSMIHCMIENGFRLPHADQDVLPEPFLEAMVLAFRNWRLSLLEEKAHIFVEEAACLQGVLDESGFLDYGEVHIRIQDTEKGLKVITGPVIVAKNPCLHPGDIRILMAMDVPHEGHHLECLENCLVFPRQGPRPHPDECSGSDLDGDTYFVSWNPDLLPPKIEEPASYVGKKPKKVDEVKLEDIFDFFVDYMKNDALGPICNAHMAFADLSPEGASAQVCLELAQLASDAVDYPKTGVPAKRDPNRHIPRTYPDFMKKRDKCMHISKKVLGKLFRHIHQHQASRPNSHHLIDKNSPHKLLIDYHRRFHDQDLLIPGYETFCRKAQVCKEDYDRSLLGIMKRYGLRREEEAVGGFFIKLPRSQRRRSLQDVQTQVSNLRHQI